MGLEAECTVRVGRKTSIGRTLLEGDRLLFRGDFQLDIAFDQMKDVTSDGGTLVVRTGEQQVHLELGTPMAERWARLIKEPKGLFEKLELGADSRVAVVNISDSLFVVALREHVASVAEGRVPGGVPIIFFGAETRDALRKVQLLRARMMDTGVLWIVRPKGSKAITEADVFDAMRSSGLVDTKVVAFSKTHTAHKAVVPVELRGQTLHRRAPIVSLPPPPPGEARKVPEPSASPSAAPKAVKKTPPRAKKR